MNDGHHHRGPDEQEQGKYQDLACQAGPPHPWAVFAFALPPDFAQHGTDGLELGPDGHQPAQQYERGQPDGQVADKPEDDWIAQQISPSVACRRWSWRPTGTLAVPAVRPDR